MCGFAGALLSRNGPSSSLEAIGRHMSDAIRHRGPDDAGVWVDIEAGLVLGHRRLSVVDLSPAGHQPMESVCRRWVIAFNGEIYNHQQLRSRIQNEFIQSAMTESSIRHNWRGHSDTETLLAGFSVWGIERTLESAIGMFAFAVWDRTKKELTIARDRAGEKPLYYGFAAGSFIFGSELKALRRFPGFSGVVDRDSLAMLVRFSFVPAPRSILKGVMKLPPGSYATISSSELATARTSLKPRRYWDLNSVIAAGQKNQFIGSAQEAADELESHLMRAVGQQMIADVPLGAFLSGGIDSSTVVALMQAQSNRPVKTFTIGFHEKNYNEAVYAAAVARHLGVDHTELYVTAQQAMDVIPQLAQIYDEPFSDSSQIPTYLVSKLAREKVTVSLSGDAGDELFGGYNRYFFAEQIWRKFRYFPLPVRRLAARCLTIPSPANWNRLFSVLANFLPDRARYLNVGDKLHKLASFVSIERRELLYLRLLSHWDAPNDLVIDCVEPDSIVSKHDFQDDDNSFTERMMQLDTLQYLPDDVLVKVDRAAMAVSLETRVPMLDHQLIAFAWQLPLEMKVRSGSGKWLLRQVLKRHVPSELFDRPKMGFGVPIDTWLRGPLRPWAEDLLAENRLVREGFFAPADIRQKWAEHLSGVRNWQYYLWDILMFQSWHEYWK